MRTSPSSRRAELSVALVDDGTIKRLNAKYRHVDEVTDVLSFPMDGNVEAEGASSVLLGDIVIDVDQAARQATSLGVSLQEEVEALAAHGLLHLLGYDDRTDEEADEMERAEEQILGRRVNGTEG